MGNKLIVFLALFYFWATPVQAATVTVSPGTFIQSVVNSAQPGDTITVLAGTYNERVSLTPNHTNLTIQAQGEVIMQGFNMSGGNNITIRGFTITTLTDSMSGGTGIYATKTANCHIENNKFLYNTWGGLVLKGGYSDPSATHDCKVTGNTFFRNGLYGMQIAGQNHLIEGNDISHTIQHHPCSASTASWLDSDGIRFHGSGHVFRNNRIHDLHFGADGWIQGKACTIANIANLSYDFVYDSHIDAMQTYGYADSEIAAYNILIENNYISLPPAAEWTGGFGAKAFQASGNAGNITIRNNVVIADFLSGFDTEVFELGKLHDINVNHNTFIGSNGLNSQGLKYTDVEGSNTVRNNIFYQQYNGVTHLITTRANVTQGYNCIWRRNGWTSPGPNDVNQNPLFVNTAIGDYRLSSNSPCKDMGAYGYTTPSPSPTPKPGDLNTDGSVNIFDFNLLISKFGNPYTTFDFNAIISHYGE